MDKSQYSRRDRLVKERRHDTYQEKKKWPDPTVCSGCGAFFTGGRWTWKETPEGAHTTVCPACQHIADNYPSGYLTLRGPFFTQHRQEILRLIHNTEKQEKKEHPMERLMAVVDEEDHTLVTTTGIHLARRIGEALKHAYQGELDFTYGEAEKSIRLNWSR